MRNINELIGIIKGIDFDGIINEKETEKLEDWVAKNRNLAYEPQQIELINLIDSILEDHIITDDEKEVLIEYCDHYLIDRAGNPSIYILQGIIQGIISDGVINDKEIERLQKWMDNNRTSLSFQPKSKVLVDTIDSILEDGVVTEEEQLLLQQVLSEQIEETQFENKIAFLKRQVKNKKNIGVDLIDLLGDDETIEKIHAMAEVQLRKSLSSYSGTALCDTEIIFISLVLIAMLNYEDGRYYESVREIYSDLYDRYSAQKIEGSIRSILNKYHLENTQKERNINAALYNAIVPAHYLSAFFAFIYDIYERNFEYDLPDDMYEDFKFVYEGLRQTMLSDGDDVHLNVTRKTYKLIKTTKQLIAREDCIDSIIKLSTIIVRLIDKQVWNKEIKIFNPYLKLGFDAWAETLINTSGPRERSTSRSELRSRWEPKYITSGNRIYIVPPVHRIKSTYDYRTVRVEVVNGDEVIFSDEHPDIRDIIGGYQIIIDKILVSKPIGKISYRLVAGNEVLYDSKDKLFRDILAFNTDGAEIRNNTDYSGTAIFCMSKEYDKITTFYRDKYYMLGNYGAHLGDALLIDETVFNFSSLVRPGVFGDEHKDVYLFDETSEKKYQVYKNIKFLVFETTDIEAVFEIEADGSTRKLQAFDHTVTKREGVNKYVVNLNNISDGIHTITIFELYKGRRSSLCSFTFAIDSKLRYECEPLVENGYIISIDSSLLPTSIVEEISAATYKTHWNKVENGGKVYSFIIPFGFEFYGFKGEQEEWKEKENELWIGDINSETILQLSDLSIDAIEVYGSNGSRIDEEIRVYERNFVKEARIGFLSSYKNTNDYFLIALLKDGKNKYPLICYNKCVLDDEIELTYDAKDKELSIVPSYKGKGRVYFSILNREGETIYKSSIVNSKDAVYVNNIKSFEEYRICFFEKKGGLSLQGDTPLGERSLIIYDWDDLIGKSFKISEVYFDQFVRGEFLRKHHYFNRTFLRIIKKEDQDIFVGELYTSTREGNYDLFRINPVSVEICGDVIDGTVELSITKYGDGLLLDFEHHGIMNTLDDANAVDIFSYIMELKGIEFV